MNTKEKEIIKKANQEIFEKLANFVIGPKIPNDCYQIGQINKKTKSQVIKVTSNSSGSGYIAIYFGQSIRISVKIVSFNLEVDDFYCIFDKEEIPQNIEEYKYIMKSFLMELVKLFVNLKYYPECYQVRSHYTLLKNCTKREKPQGFYAFENEHWYNFIEKIASYRYSWSRPDELVYMTEVFKSKRFKRMLGTAS